MSLTYEDRQRIKRARHDAKKKELASVQVARHPSDPVSDRTIRRRAASERTKRVPQHGTKNEYSNYGCRCDACVEANRDFIYETRKIPCKNYETCGNTIWKNTNRSGLCRQCSGALRKKPKHGTEACYLKGCRREECRKAASAARLARMHAISDEKRQALREKDRKRKQKARTSN